MTTTPSRAELIAKLRSASALPNIRKAKQIRRKGESMVESLPGEIWVDIVGWEEYYQISNFERVKSLTRIVPGPYGSTCLRRGALMVPQYDGNQFRVHLSSVELGKNEVTPIKFLMSQVSFSETTNTRKACHV